MAGSGKKRKSAARGRKGDSKPAPGSDSGGQSAGPAQTAAAAPSPGTAKRPVLRFVVLFGVFIGVFYLLMSRPLLQQKVFPAYLRLNTTASAALLRFFGTEVTTYKHTISSRQATIEIRRGCDAIDPTALFVAAVLATPVSVFARSVGVIGGTILLALINLARIITLFYTRIHFPKLFETMHLEVWQGLFICLSLVLWIAWALWATKPKAIASSE